LTRNSCIPAFAESSASYNSKQELLRDLNTSEVLELPSASKYEEKPESISLELMLPTQLKTSQNLL
jgi:hypothetical protein